MVLLAELLDTFLRGIVLMGVAVALGGIAWGLWVLRAGPRPVMTPSAPIAAVRRGLALVWAGAVAVGVGQGLLLTLKALALSNAFGAEALGDFADTLHFVAGATRILVALAMAAAVAWLQRAIDASSRWLIVAALAVLLAASGAWLTHGTGRVDDRAALMTRTALHQVAASIWVGGLVQLGACWRLARQSPLVDGLWPELVARFSRLAGLSVLALVLSALPLAWTYTESVSGLVGTGYGALLLTKVTLMGAALVLAACNWRIARRGGEPGPQAPLRTRLPRLVETEAIILVMALLTAATLSAQPPAIDVAPADRATLAEVAEVFRPKLPDLHTPSVEIMRRNRAEAATIGGERAPDAYRWSNFSHNV